MVFYKNYDIIQVKLCKYALLLATHILTTIEYDDMDKPIIEARYAVNESWQKGKFVADRKFKTGFMITHSGRHLWKVSALQIQCTKRRGFCGITAFLSKTGEIIMHVLRFKIPPVPYSSIFCQITLSKRLILQFFL